MIVTDITGIGDPQIVLYKGVYYCYATHSAQGIDVWKSEDLVHWQGPKLCFDAKAYWGYKTFWAPEVVYHKGRFVMHYTATRRGKEGKRLGVAVSDSPEGPFEDVNNVPLFDFGYDAIDGSALVTENGNFLYFSHDWPDNIIDGVGKSQVWCVRLNDDLTKTIGEPALMTSPDREYEMKSLAVKLRVPVLWNEGPCVIKWHDKYLMNYSANYYATNDYAICLAAADDPMGPWIKVKSNPVLSRRGDLFGAGHNAFFTDKEGQLRTSFHVQTDPEHPSGDRRVVIGKVTLTETPDGIVETIE